MADRPGQLHLNAFLAGSGHHEAAWRLPESDPLASTDLGHFRRLAALAEGACFDSLFLADLLAVTDNVRFNSNEALDPLVLLSALAATTDRIGLIATTSTTYSDPFSVARRFASLDHVSGGRAGWNVVTSYIAPEAANFGLDEPLAHAVRYRRATEFVEVCRALWDSWDPDARVADKAAGRYVREGAVRPIGHRGEFLSVGGALNVPPGPQGHPVLVQAGSSGDGRDFAARFAEAVFTAQQELEGAVAFADDLRARVRRAGRDPAQVKLLPGLVPVIGSTEAEAREREERLQERIVSEYALFQLALLSGVEVAERDLDGPMPPLPDEQSVQAGQSRFALIKRLAEEERLTVRQILGRLAGGRGHRVRVGTPEQIADEMEAWFAAGAADGFNVMPPTLPGGLELFVEHVVPELRRRGLFRSEYAGSTLREHLGLARPGR